MREGDTTAMHAKPIRAERIARIRNILGGELDSLNLRARGDRPVFYRREVG